MWAEAGPTQHTHGDQQTCRRNGRPQPGIWPSRRLRQRFCARISELPFNGNPSFTDRLETLPWVFHETSLHERAKRRGYTRWQRRPVRLAINHPREYLGDILAWKRRSPAQHLEQHGTERPNVAAFVGGPPLRLL